MRSDYAVATFALRAGISATEAERLLRLWHDCLIDGLRQDGVVTARHFGRYHVGLRRWLHTRYAHVHFTLSGPRKQELRQIYPSRISKPGSRHQSV